MCSVCLVFFAITPCIAFFDTVFVSLSHFTCLTNPSERKGALSVYHDIKKKEFKEYVGNAFLEDLNLDCLEANDPYL